jgi:hypothetical protein
VKNWKTFSLELFCFGLYNVTVQIKKERLINFHEENDYRSCTGCLSGGIFFACYGIDLWDRLLLAVFRHPVAVTVSARSMLQPASGHV